MDFTLSPNVKEFIRQKVKKLGSLNAVYEFYSSNYLVDKYARYIAKEIYCHHDLLKPISSMPATTSEPARTSEPAGTSEQVRISEQAKRSDIVRAKNKTTPKLRPSKNDLKKREEYIAALERKREREKQSGGIPEHEEGYPKDEFGTRADHKKMRARDFGDVMRSRKE